MSAQTAVLYDGKRVIPAPIVGFSKNYRRSGDQSGIGAEHRATITGTLVGCKGWDFTSGNPEFYEGSDYPADGSVDTCSKFKSLVQMQDKLRELFAIDNEYKWFEILGCGPANPIRKWRARVASVDFEQGQWTDIASYTISLVLQADDIEDADIHINHSETWNIQFNEEGGGIYTLNHTLSCQSEEFIDDSGNYDGWYNAKEWLDSRLSGSDYTDTAPTSIKNNYIFDTGSSSGFDLSNDYSAYDYTVQKSLDEYDGTYSITETWTLAKDPVFRRWNLTYSKQRNDFGTVTLDGEFTSFLNRTDENNEPTNSGIALEAFNTWEDDDGPYSIANSYYDSLSAGGILGSCPVMRTVTTVQESRGDGATTHGAETRSVKFNFEFSDSDPLADVSITNSLSKSLIDNCETRVSIQANIQGHECGTTSKLTNALSAYSSIDTTSLADDIYEGSNELVLVSSSYSENEYDGTVTVSDEFSDKFTDSILSEETIAVSYTCGDLKSDGTSKTIYSISGTKKGTCGGVTPEAPEPNSYEISESGRLQRSTVTTDQINNVVTYNYEFDDDLDGDGLVEISVETSLNEGDCNVTHANVSFSVEGNGCDSSTKFANASLVIDGLNAIDYVPSYYSKTSFVRSENKTRGTIQETYGFSSETAASLEVTIAESNEQSDCAITITSIEGEIRGRCFEEISALNDAELVFSDHGINAYSSYGYLVSSNVSKNEKRGTIRFSYVFSNEEQNYKHEQTVSENENKQEGTKEITISGTITPYCVENQVSVGNSAWSSIESELDGTAGSLCDGATHLNSTTVSKNKRNGQVQYSYTYLCSSGLCTSGAIKESITITRDAPSDVVAIVPVLGRTCGPLLQDKSTKTVERCTVVIDVLFPRNTGCLYDKPTGTPDPSTIISGLGYCSDDGYVEKDTDSWNPTNGKYTRTYTKICKCC